MKKLTLLSEDNFLKDLVLEIFKEDEVSFSENDISEVLVFDNSTNKIDFTKYKKIINISSNVLNDSDINFKQPFKIRDFLSELNYVFYDDTLNDFIELEDLRIDLKSSSIFNKKNEKSEKLTGKELSILEYLSNNEKATKTDLLTKVWDYSFDSETKVVESTIYKLRQKFKNLEIEDFIIFDNGYYRLKNG